MYGNILGMRVTNLDGTPQHPSDAFALRNFPSQTFGSGFVASFYARFDYIGSPLNFQRIFEFGVADSEANSIACGQYDTYLDFFCEVFEGNTLHEVIAPNAIVVGEFAFWHFGEESNGTMWLDKDNGDQYVQSDDLFEIPALFRPELKFGRSGYLLSGDLDGIVLGFRLDRKIVS